MASVRIQSSSFQEITIRFSSTVRAELKTIHENLLDFQKNKNLTALIAATPDENKKLVAFVARKILTGEKYKIEESIIHGGVGMQHFDIDILSERENPVVPEERSLGPNDLSVPTCKPYEMEH